MVQINWTKQAVADLQNIYDFIALNSKHYAKRKIIKIKLKTTHIKKHIYIGRIVPEFNQKQIREVIEGKYRIVYKIIDKNKIDILTVHHSSRDLIELT